jgi:alpha-L-fucosidase 2
MEWPEEFKDSENGGHRHLSHLFGLHPGSQITPRGTPELAAAARKSLEVRLANGAGGCEWSSAWTINLFARLLDAEKAHEYILWHLNRMIAPNLFDVCGGPFMIDGNFGYTAGVCEMLLQSQERIEDRIQNPEVRRMEAGFVLNLLPALPKAWPNGSIKGLRARGGFEVDMTWAEGKVVTLTVKSTLGKRCRIRSATPLKMEEGWFKPSVKPIDATVIEFDTKAGKTYTLAALPGNSKSNK